MEDTEEKNKAVVSKECPCEYSYRKYYSIVCQNFDMRVVFLWLKLKSLLFFVEKYFGVCKKELYAKSRNAAISIA